MNEDQLQQLAEKISAGVATDEELVLYSAWYQSFQQEDEVWSDSGSKDKIAEQLRRSIEDRIRAQPASRPRVPLRRIAAVALVLVVAYGVAYWWGDAGGDTLQELVISNDVEPGMETAILTLGDGSQIVLDDVKAGVIAQEGITSIAKSSDGLLTYHADQIKAVADVPVTFNTITTPKGGKYSIVLPDQTEVWLNAMSSIRFPTRFDGSVREVEISGEVYFDVRHKKNQPFWVKTDKYNVKVLGTKFNVKAYDEEVYQPTTLIQGEVMVESGDKQVLMKPGQQVWYDNQGNLVKEEVDTNMVTAWKYDLFQFWNTDLEDIMRQLSRWYDVDVLYLNEPRDISFTGFISRDVTISNVLQMMEATGNIKFGLKGREVTVMVGEEKENKNL